MSSVGSPGNTSTSKYTNAPDKGSFPLDRTGACTLELKSYLACLKENGQKIENCKFKSAEYLKCRMNNNLMEKEDLSKLGLPDK